MPPPPLSPQACKAKAVEINCPMNIAVCDAHLETKGFLRMDGAWIGSIDIAMKKARTARDFNMDTRDIGPLCQPGQPLYGIEHSNQGLITFGGGVLLKACPLPCIELPARRAPSAYSVRQVPPVEPPIASPRPRTLAARSSARSASRGVQSSRTTTSPRRASLARHLEVCRRQEQLPRVHLPVLLPPLPARRRRGR